MRQLHIGIIATYLALQGKDIIGLLTMAYSVYTPGIVAPLAVAIIAHKKFMVKKTLWYAGVIIGGLFGLIPAILASTAKIQSPAGKVHSDHARKQTNHGDAAGGLQPSCL